MAGLKLTVHDNLTAALVKELGAAATKAEHILAIQVQKDTEPFVPALTKSFANRTQVVENKVIYPGPYARFLYYGKLMIDPATGSAWAPKGATKSVTGTNLRFSKVPHSQAQAHWCEASKAQNLEKWLGIAKKAVEDGLK